MAESIVIVDRLTELNPAVIPAVSNLRCSWEISRIGLMSCDIPIKDLPSSCYPPQKMKRRWVRYSHPSAGPWGGVVTSVSSQDGVVTLDCQSFASMLRGAYSWSITSTDIFTGLKQAIDNMAVHTGISWGSLKFASPTEIDTYPNVTHIDAGPDFFQNGQDLYDTILQNAIDKMYDEDGWRSNIRGLAWNVDPITRQIFIDYTYGEVRDGRDPAFPAVIVQDGIHCVNSSWTDDSDNIVNDIHFYGKYFYVTNDTTSWNGPFWQSTATASASTAVGTEKNKGKHHHGGGTSPPPPATGGDPSTEPGYWYYTPVITAVTHTGNTMIPVRDDTSYNKYGLKHATINKTNKTYDNVDLMTSEARNLCADLAREIQLVTIELNNEQSIQSRFREGDVIKLALANNGRQGSMVIRTRALDTTRGTMVISGEAVLS